MDKVNNKKKHIIIFAIIIFVIAVILFFSYWDHVDKVAEMNYKSSDSYKRTQQSIQISEDIIKDSSQSSDNLNIISKYFMDYGEDNYCEIYLVDDKDHRSVIMYCKFDGKNIETEVKRAMALLCVCNDMSNQYTNGDYSSMFYSGKETGIIVFENGESKYASLPSNWEQFWDPEEMVESVLDEVNYISENMEEISYQ